MATTINGNKTVTVTAIKNTYVISCGSGGTGQSLKVVVNGYGTLTDGGSYTVNYGTTWTASLTPSTGYNAGTISPAASGTVTSTTAVTATAAAKKTFTVTLGSHPNCDVVISGYGEDATNTNKEGVPYNTVITATATPHSGYKVDSVVFS